jgi:hypothetical protein
MHCTHPGVAIVPQRTGPPPPSSPVAAPLEPPLEPLEPPSVPLDAPPELPPEPPLETPPEEPVPDDPLEDPDPPSEPVVLELLPLQPTPMATAVAIASPRDVFNNDMACLILSEGSS